MSKNLEKQITQYWIDHILRIERKKKDFSFVYIAKISNFREALLQVIDFSVIFRRNSPKYPEIRIEFVSDWFLYFFFIFYDFVMISRRNSSKSGNPLSCFYSEKKKNISQNQLNSLFISFADTISYCLTIHQTITLLLGEKIRQQYHRMIDIGCRIWWDPLKAERCELSDNR